MAEARVVDPGALQPLPKKAHMFTGPAEVREISEALGMSYIEINALYLEPGARSRPHRHDVEQVVYFLQGPGVVTLEGGEDQLVGTGEFAHIPAGVVHMHGAADDGPAVFVSFIATEHTAEFDVPLPAGWERYANGAVA